MRGHRPFVLAAMLALLLGGRGEALAQQGGAALRDSLAHATDVLAYHPDSVDLRLKKAAWNIQLEQWNYAKDELDKVLFLNQTNIAGLFYRAFVNEKLKRYNFARLDYQNLLVWCLATSRHSWDWRFSTRKTNISPRLTMASTV